MIEVTRLKARVGGFVKYTDKADIYRPDPVSTHFIGGNFLPVIASRGRQVRQGLRCGRQEDTGEGIGAQDYTDKQA
jgi:hypothetical protein